jgi:hypothetical protein
MGPLARDQQLNAARIPSANHLPSGPGCVCRSETSPAPRRRSPRGLRQRERRLSGRRVASKSMFMPPAEVRAQASENGRFTPRRWLLTVRTSEQAAEDSLPAPAAGRWEYVTAPFVADAAMRSCGASPDGRAPRRRVVDGALRRSSHGVVAPGAIVDTGTRLSSREGPKLMRLARCFPNRHRPRRQLVSHARHARGGGRRSSTPCRAANSRCCWTSRATRRRRVPRWWSTVPLAGCCGWRAARSFRRSSITSSSVSDRPPTQARRSGHAFTAAPADSAGRRTSEVGVATVLRVSPRAATARSSISRERPSRRGCRPGFGEFHKRTHPR